MEVGITCEVQKPFVIDGASASEEGYLYARSSHVETVVEELENKLRVRPRQVDVDYRTRTVLPRTGVMIIGICGNNGTTFASGVLANRMQLTWETVHGVKQANWIGSVAMNSTFKLGELNNKDLYVPVRNLLPMLNPNDLVLGGWDINGFSMSEALKRAAVLPIELQRQLYQTINDIRVYPGVYQRDFIAANQEFRADNCVAATAKQHQLDQLRKDIAHFKATNDLEKVIVLWNGNTERFSDHTPGIHDTAQNLLDAIHNDHPEIAPSLLYCVAAILEGCAYINGSPQNTFCDGALDLAKQHNVMLAGDDLKTGQTKFKSVMMDFLVSTALKPTAIVSYNHLGNNDGLNLASAAQFKSKEITKASVVEDMIASNKLLYSKHNEHPDHLIVIKYVPTVGDSKRALDEYTTEIFMGGTQTIVAHNTCEDSLLAAPIILDLVLFMELIQRIQVKVAGDSDYKQVGTLNSLLSLFLKAPRVPKHAPVINALFSQKEALFEFMRAAAGLPSRDWLCLSHRMDK